MSPPQNNREFPRQAVQIAVRIGTVNTEIEAHREGMAKGKRERLQLMDQLQEMGLNGSEIAELLGVSRQRISQMRSKSS